MKGARNAPWGPEEQLGGCAGGLQCKGHRQLAEETALGLVTEGTRVACPPETLRGLWGHVASGAGGQSQGEGAAVAEPLPVPGLSPGCRVALQSPCTG